MSSAPQILTQEISDADLDTVSGGLLAGVAGDVCIEGPVSVHIAGAAGISTPDVLGLVPSATLSA